MLEVGSYIARHRANICWPSSLPGAVLTDNLQAPDAKSATLQPESKKHKLVVWITRVVMFSKIDKHISTLYFAVDSTVLNINKLQ
uniref:Uncharacterized protein n=1 Tax=Romanomermis culicivorax TaxID=13658 RepID=A0A915K2L0_ROMCU